jgi:acyl carrier protein
VNNANTALKNKDSQPEDRNTVAARIRRVLAAHGRLGTDAMLLADGDDLYAAGLTSLASVNVMLALEAEFDIEFPDSMLNRSAFASVGAIESAVRKITRS